MQFAEIAVDVPWSVDRTFSYSVPDHIELLKGNTVWVPFGKRKLQGVAFDVNDTPVFDETRAILSVIDKSLVLSETQLSLARWISSRYLSSLFEATSLMLPPGFRRKIRDIYRVTPGTLPSLAEITPFELKVVDILNRAGPSGILYIRKKLGFRGVTAIDRLVKRGLVLKDKSVSKPQAKPKYTLEVRLAVKETEATAYHLGTKKNARLQRSLLEMMLANPNGIPLPEIQQKGIGRQVVYTLERKGILSTRRIRIIRDPLGSRHFRRLPKPNLTREQEKAWVSVCNAITEDYRGLGKLRPKRSFLLRGVTGSGKTELYMRALEKVIAMGRKGIVLVPEISLTPQTIERFSSRFPGKVAVLHSGLKSGEKFDEWWRVRNGEFDVVVGSRSALFAPQPDLGLIVLDEEHDGSYKQSDPPPRYQSRDVALELGKLNNSVVILGSATPDLATYYKAEIGEIELLEINSRAPFNPKDCSKGSLSMPAIPTLPLVDIVDMRNELKAGNVEIFSKLLKLEMASALRKGEQVILFLNRRGSASFVQCRSCGLVSKCRRCEVSLTYHESQKKLVCHHCGAKISKLNYCRDCGEQSISYLGVGTQRIELEVRKLFPHAKVLRWDRDTIGPNSRNEDMLRILQRHEADVLIGTQMIAKGLDLPLVTLVGVVSADVGINFPDFRASERVFQVLSQVAGRSGRGPLAGRVIIQTFNPEHHSVLAAANHDYLGFYNIESIYRKQNSYPPYSRFARLIYVNSSPNRAEKEAQRIAVKLRKSIDIAGMPGIDVLGPVPCYIPRVKGQYRWHILIRSNEPEVLLRQLSIGDGWAIDVDPIALL